MNLKRMVTGVGAPPAALAVGLGASLAGVFVFLKISDEIMEQEFLQVDKVGLHTARQIQSARGDRVVLAVTHTGGPLELAALGSAGVIGLFVRGHTADAVTLAAAAAGSGAIVPVLKALFHRPRPPLKLRRAPASGYSYPSGHAFTSLTTYGGIAYLASRHGQLTGHPAARWFWAPGLLWAGLVGLSRVYLEVHYPTDVLASWSAGTIWLTACIFARNFMEPEES